jgi:hypothetical protein
LEALDREDCLAAFRYRFDLPNDTIYLDGNSLGAMPRSTPTRIDCVVRQEWRNDLNASWWKHNWLDLPRRIGDKIARILGADQGEVIVSDSTSLNLFKLLVGALQLMAGRGTILLDSSNFPGDLYVAQSAARVQNRKLRIVAPARLVDELDEDVAVVMFSQVDFRTGRLVELRPVAEQAHAVGALVLCDLSHSAGVMPLALGHDGIDGGRLPSSIGLSCIGGLIKHLPALTAIGSSTVNSYRRLWDTGFWAPIYADWGYQNRTCALRISEPGRLEYRSVDSMVNPYLMSAALLAAFDAGIQENLDPGEPESRNVYEAEKSGKAGRRLPMHLGQALEALEADEIIRTARPGDMYRVFMDCKRIEWEKFLATTTEWDLETYLEWP